METSGEAEPKMLDMARRQGEALKEAADFMMHEEADHGGETHAGDFLVGYAVESAEGLYHYGRNWQVPCA